MDMTFSYIRLANKFLTSLAHVDRVKRLYGLSKTEVKESDFLLYAKVFNRNLQKSQHRGSKKHKTEIILR